MGGEVKQQSLYYMSRPAGVYQSTVCTTADVSPVPLSQQWTYSTAMCSGEYN